MDSTDFLIVFFLLVTFFIIVIKYRFCLVCVPCGGFGRGPGFDDNLTDNLNIEVNFIFNFEQSNFNGSKMKMSQTWLVYEHHNTHHSTEHKQPGILNEFSMESIFCHDHNYTITEFTYNWITIQIRWNSCCFFERERHISISLLFFFFSPSPPFSLSFSPFLSLFLFPFFVSFTQNLLHLFATKFIRNISLMGQYCWCCCWSQ